MVPEGPLHPSPSWSAFLRVSTCSRDPGCGWGAPSAAGEALEPHPRGPWAPAQEPHLGPTAPSSLSPSNRPALAFPCGLAGAKSQSFPALSPCALHGGRSPSSGSCDPESSRSQAHMLSASQSLYQGWKRRQLASVARNQKYLKMEMLKTEGLLILICICPSARSGAGAGEGLFYH